MAAAKHGGSFQIVARNPNVWRAKCSCREEWSGATYEVVEDGWREHYWQVKGVTPSPQGDKANRWQPAT